ncbi:MAG: Na/Pi symporter, partial [Acetatifactor sp.]|nr:Na/Pi symporter [Acetatifactor sp.]
MGVFLGMLVRMGAGVGIFLYGMHLISGYLEELAGTAMERGLRYLTVNPWIGALTGMVITTLVQSSTAVTVMTVNFVDRGMMTLHQAVGVILGANVGTASTGVLAALPIRSMAPLFLVGGAALVLAADVLGKVQEYMPQKWKSVRSLPARIKLAGALCMGLGMLLLGMELMQEAMVPCRSLRGLTRLLADLDHPLGGVLGGAVFTALIQSSSASVAILQSMAAEGMVGLQQSAYIVYG